MRFEARELTSHAQPINAAELRNGETYFAVQFVDDHMFIPTVEPLIFIGSDLEAGDSGQHYFQDAGSFQRGVRYSSSSDDDEGAFYRQPSDELKHIFTFERGLDVLLGCSLRRKGTRGSS